MAGERICSFEGCNNPLKTKWLCHSHYQQMRRGKPLSPLKKKKPNPFIGCLAEGCLRKHHCKGYCNLHYMRVVTHGSTELREAVKVICSAPGCLSVAGFRSGLCRKHYGKLRVTGTLEYQRVVRPKEDVSYRDDSGRKQCVKCLVFKNEADFNKSINSSDGLAWCCRKCLNYLRLVSKWGESAVAKKENGCEICGSKQGKICVDHDHYCCPGQKTCGRCIRGVLCQKCNRGIGLFNDDIDRMKLAIDYLAKAKAK